MQVSHGELRALDMDWQVDFAATGKILDITVTPMFRAPLERS